jgi:hypothetical protein
MTDRERWIVYPLLLLTMGISLRGKAYPTKKVDADRVESKDLHADRIECDELIVTGLDGKPAVVLGSSKSGGLVTAISADHALELTLGHFERTSSLFVEAPTSKGTAVWALLGNLRRFAPQGLIQRLSQFPIVDPRLERSPMRVEKSPGDTKTQSDAKQSEAESPSDSKNSSETSPPKDAKPSDEKPDEKAKLQS